MQVKATRILDRVTADLHRKTLTQPNLMARKGNACDLANCYALHKSLRLPYAEASQRIVLEMWHILLSRGAMHLCVVEDRGKSVNSRIVSFNAVAFVTDEFCSHARSTLHAYLSVELARRYLSSQLPVMNREQVAEANTCEGLNVVMCFEGWTHDGLSREQFLALREKQSEALHYILIGYRIKEFLADTLDRETLEWMLNAGARLRRDHSNYFRNRVVCERAPSLGPFLVGLTKKEAFSQPGSNLASLFIYTPPRFHFNRSQRVLLQHALTGETCEALARSLSISAWTVKKRWHAIYDRVGDVDSALLPPAIACGSDTSSRGMERRRHLLNYLRQHPEELRPFKRSQPKHGRRF